ncbi:peptidylprolyl isomerase [Pontibacter lucknowensis]|uniref:Peptidyl-prolyl cis-trans isomerase SurA n=1 Tax=Pontibacter lucknowensis TaxID=1077936 RepID=A0A1N6TQE7_9BACT|nr:peptidylprolyl isomerase [Pontibacter lucknowensis]SIQ55477.1 peptidyl-prolyl cis-trans isomerase SurA [Pontibacter lucknowensis]
MRSNQLLVAAAALLMAGCTATRKNDKQEPIIATIGSQPIYTSEFQYVYEKNNGGNEDAYTRQSVSEYLDLYTRFKLKVMEGESRGLDTTTAFKRELEGYKEQLAQPYLTEKSVTDQLVQEAYERLKQEVNASHILLGLPNDPSPQDTLAAYNQALELRKRLEAGEAFEKLAREFSHDPSAAENGGNLGYFTAMQMVYRFEDAAYKTPVGQISMPVRTRFGYHLIKVNDKRAAQGEVKVAHIMVRATPGMPKADSLAAKQRIDAIYKRVQRNESWDRLAAEFSEDANSAANGGELPWFGTGRMIPSFEEVSFALKKEGEVAPPVLTPYGWHIIKLIGKQSLPPFEDMEQNLRNKIAKDSRSELNKAAFLKRIKSENNFSEDATVKAAALGKATDALMQGKWDYDTADKTLKNTLFTIQGKPYTVADFYTYVKAEQRPRMAGTPQHHMSSLYDNFVQKSLLAYERANLENKYPDYRMLVREYHDGILLFQLMDEKVWSKAVEDTAGLQAYFEQNRDKYQWKERAHATVISAANAELLTKAQQQLSERRYEVRNGKPADITFETNSATPDQASIARLNELADRLSNNPNLTLEVNGHADAREAAGKRDLSAERSQAIMAYLTARGVAADQLSAKALGKTKQAAADNTETGRRRNRRVSFTLYSSELSALADNLNAGNPLGVQIVEKKFQKGENKAVDAVKWEKGSYNTELNGRQYLVIVHDVLAPAPKQLSEVRGQVTADYQNYLDEQWVKQLQEKNPVSVNQTEVDKIIRK